LPSIDFVEFVVVLMTYKPRAYRIASGIAILSLAYFRLFRHFFAANGSRLCKSLPTGPTVTFARCQLRLSFSADGFPASVSTFSLLSPLGPLPSPSSFDCSFLLGTFLVAPHFSICAVLSHRRFSFLLTRFLLFCVSFLVALFSTATTLLRLRSPLFLVYLTQFELSVAYFSRSCGWCPKVTVSDGVRGLYSDRLFDHRVCPPKITQEPSFLWAFAVPRSVTVALLPQVASSPFP